MAQKAILVKNGADVIGKLVFGGDLSSVDSIKTQLESLNPSFTFTKYESDEDSAFVSAEVIISPPEIVRF